MSVRPVLAVLAVGLALAAAVQWVRTRPEPAFPHREHARLFPLCTGCHVGIETGDDAELYPPPESCVSCHDGEREDPVDWDGPRRRPSNLAFSHLEHEAEARAAGQPIDCADCHGVDGSRVWMDVAAATAENCIACHAHEAPSHLAAEAECRVCHVPLVDAPELGVPWVAALPRPESHEDPEFLRIHAGTDADAALANCAVCHARPSCERCHANAPSVPAIAALRPDPRVAAVVAGLAAEYPLPASHQVPDWRLAHGAEAEAAVQSCANCHTRPSCDACHIGPGAGPQIAALPEPRPGAAPGVPAPPGVDAFAVRVGAGRRAANLVHPPGWERYHGGAAEADGASCSGCHATEAFCTDCHDGASSRRFHLPNYVARHATDAYGAAGNCASCHNREVFCRSCHVEMGRGSQGRLDAAYHDAQPLWLLQHGQAARQSLESCTTCHVQRDCMQCHSATGGWRINPHGPDFDPRAGDRNPIACARCHLGGPPGRRP